MKNKILAILVAFVFIFNFSLAASEVDSQTKETPNWIKVKYSNLYNQSVSEYQLVTVSVSNYGLWFLNNEYNVSVDYDPNQLKLANTYYTDSMQNTSIRSGASVATEDNNFAVNYQFYLQPNNDVTSVPITVTKTKNGDDIESATIDLKTYSETTPRMIEMGSIKLKYNVTTYTNDGTNIEYNIHFEVVSNPDREEFTLSLKKNNMAVSNPDIYEAKLRFSSGKATAIDKNNFNLMMTEGDAFDLNVTTSIEGLTAKDDRFDFFIYLQSGDDFVRLSPIYYRSELVMDSINTRVTKYIYITVAIAIFFALLTVLYIVSNKRRSAISKK